MKKIEEINPIAAKGIAEYSTNAVLLFNKAYFMDPVKTMETLSKGDDIRTIDTLLDEEWVHFKGSDDIEYSPHDILDACIFFNRTKAGTTSMQLLALEGGSSIVIGVTVNIENSSKVHVGFVGTPEAYDHVMTSMSLTSDDIVTVVLDE